MSTKWINHSIEIAATPRKIWDVLLQDETYRKWTAPFHPGSYAETDWQVGSKALFLTPERDGMVSRIKEHEPASVITIEHLGVVKRGVEVMDDPEVQKWSGLTETYRVKKSGAKTQLLIEQEIDEEWVEFMNTKWREALVKVKELAESDE